MNRNEILKKLRDRSPYLKENFGVLQIGLFGSFERENEQDSSDIDLLVNFEKGHKDFFNYMRLKEYLEDILEREVDLVSEPALKDRIREKVLDEVEYV